MECAMDNRPVSFLERSEEITGYRVKILPKSAFQISGYTLIIPPKNETQMIPQFVEELIADGRLETLKRASSIPAWILGLGSWDEECQPGGMRYTMCIEETAHTDLNRLLPQYSLHTQSFEACEWMCFEVPQGNNGLNLFWNDDPYKMLRALGYRFHLRVGVHFDAYPPEYDEKYNPGMEFWISVAKQDENCDNCSVREDCGKIQPFT
jgi:predicted transcriptional regulator YdeE